MFSLIALLSVTAVQCGRLEPVPKFKTLLPQYFNMPRVDPIDPRKELTTEVFRIGPFHLSPGQVLEGRDVYLPRPAASSLIEVSSFGKFGVEFENGTNVPRDTLYFHHILAYDQSNSKFIAGASNERTDWGPNDLPYPYRVMIQPGARIKANGFHFNNLKRVTYDFYVTYEVSYKIHNPADPAIRVTESFYWMDNYNVPGGNARNSTYERTRSVSIPKDMIIVSMNGHLHQGGKRLIARFADSSRAPNDLCIAYNLYHESYPCAWDCNEICPYKSDWTFQWATTTCYMELPVRAGEKVLSIAEYDNSCSWRGVMAWWFNFGWAGSYMGDMSAIDQQ